MFHEVLFTNLKTSKVRKDAVALLLQGLWSQLKGNIKQFMISPTLFAKHIVEDIPDFMTRLNWILNENWKKAQNLMTPKESKSLVGCPINYHICSDQAPAGSRDIPGSRDWPPIPIPGFLKIKSRDFSGFLYSTQDNVCKDFYWFSDKFGGTPRTFLCLKCFLCRPW